MIKTLLTIFTCFTFCISAFNQNGTYSQYFDGADTAVSNSILIDFGSDTNNIWQIGPPQKPLFNNAASVPNVLITDTINFYPMGDTSRFVAKVYNDWYPFGIMALQWKQKLDFDTTYDGGIVEFSIDQGTSWQNVYNNPYVYSYYGFDLQNIDTLPGSEVGFSGTDTNWRDIWLCFDMSWMSNFPDTLYFRFSSISDSVDNLKEGWMIDNMLAHLTMIHTITEIEQSEYIRVTPIPANKTINIQTKKLDEYHVIEHMELINSNGEIVDKYGLCPTKFFINVENQPNGIYFLNIKTNIKEERHRIIIQH